MINGEEIAVGGLPEYGVVVLDVGGHKHELDHPSYAGPEEAWNWNLSLSGLHRPEPGIKEFPYWADHMCDIGDHVVIELIETDTVSKVIKARREPPEETIPPSQQLERMRTYAAELEAFLAADWRAQPPAPPSSEIEALKVRLNGGPSQVCGLEAGGVLSLMISGYRNSPERSHTGEPDAEWTWSLSVHGLRTAAPGIYEHLYWLQGDFAIGDTVEVELVQTDEVARPIVMRRKPRKPITNTPQAQLERLRVKIAKLEAEIAGQNAD